MIRVPYVTGTLKLLEIVSTLKAKHFLFTNGMSDGSVHIVGYH